MKNIALACTSPEFLPEINTHAEQLALPCLGVVDPKFCDDAEQLLILSDVGWGLQQTGRKAPGMVQAEFASGSVAHRRQFGGGKGQMIAKAVGLGQGVYPTVCDLTAGLGKDGFVLATLGCPVTLVERSPVVNCLLQDGLSRGLSAAQDQGDAELQNILGRLSLYQGDGKAFLQTTEQVFDVIYLDPMFPGRDKSAQVKKEMVAFQTVVGKDPDADELLPQALNFAKHRVVVKRPKKSPHLNNQTPSYTLDGKSCRYDIYTLKAFQK